MGIIYFGTGYLYSFQYLFERMPSCFLHRKISNIVVWIWLNIYFFIFNLAQHLFTCSILFSFLKQYFYYTWDLFLVKMFCYGSLYLCFMNDSKFLLIFFSPFQHIFYQFFYYGERLLLERFGYFHSHSGWDVQSSLFDSWSPFFWNGGL